MFRKSLADQVSTALVEFIIEQDLKDGDQLPSTAELAEQFGVSRTVVREALADLDGRGILLRSQGKESVVATPGSEELHQLLSFRIWRDDVDLMDIQAIREVLEVKAAQLAADNRTEAHVAEMERRLAKLKEALAQGSDAAYHEADVDFHRLVSEASHNRLIPLILDSLTPLLYETRIKATAGRRARGESFEPIFQAHRDILRRIAARDSEGAKKAMEHHLRQTREGLDAALRSRRSAPRRRAAKPG